MERKKIRVDVVSDNVCPWCYLGKRRLEKAIASRSDRYDVEVRFHPFELSPDLPKEGLPRRVHFERKFGNLDRIRDAQARLAELGKADGISFAFDKQEKAPNTFDSHRLLWLADREGVQGALLDALFRAEFEEGRDIGDPEVLVELAAGAGLDRERVRAFLASEEGAAEVRAAEEHARGLGVTGVPFFVVEGEFAVSGAQSPEVLASMLDRGAA